MNLDSRSIHEQVVVENQTTGWLARKWEDPCQAQAGSRRGADHCHHLDERGVESDGESDVESDGENNVENDAENDNQNYTFLSKDKKYQIRSKF